MADKLSDKIREALEGFPATSPEQLAAIAGLIAENLEDFQDEVLR